MISISNEKLKALRSVIVAEFARRRREEHQFKIGDVAEWLIAERRPETLAALEDLVEQAADRYNDDNRVRSMVKKDPDLRLAVPRLRDASEECGVSMAYLLALNVTDVLSALKAVALIAELRAGEAQMEADLSQAELERVTPVMEGNPAMTIGEAMRELKRQTDETVRRFEADNGPTSKQ